MSRQEKLIKRLVLRPSDFTFEELTTLLGHYGYSLISGGRTGGSRVIFKTDNGDYIRLHKPHPRKILKLYQVDAVIMAFKERGLL